MFMKLKDGKSKVLTLSYDDGVVQDIRLVEILNKHGIKATFNLNSGKFVPEDKVRQRFYGRMKLSEAKALLCDSGHEVAVHSVTHPYLERLKPVHAIQEILEDRKNLEQHFGGIVRGMAYPYGTYSQEVMEIAKHCGICYSRTVAATGSYRFPENWLKLDPTCHHRDLRLMELLDAFLNTKPKNEMTCWMFYLWGHSYEFDDHDNWHIIEEFAEKAGGWEDVWYATNIEIYDYVQAYQALQTSVDGKTVHNPTDTDVWVWQDGKTTCIPAATTVNL